MKQTNTEWNNEEIEDYMIQLLINNCHEILQLEHHNINVTKRESHVKNIQNEN